MLLTWLHKTSTCDIFGVQRTARSYAQILSVGLRALAITLLLFNFSAFAKPNDAGASSGEIARIDHNLKVLGDDIAILRRDETNYRIEKDLLKEAYSSNLQTINIAVTIILGVLGLLGTIGAYFGFKSIKEVRDDYQKELRELTQLKEKLDIEIKLVIEKQAQVTSQVTTIEQVNTAQNDRLKVLEIVEKAGQYYQLGNVRFALEFINTGLQLDPENLMLLHLKAQSHTKEGEFGVAIETETRILELAPNSDTVICNLAELFLVSRRIEEFDAHNLKYQTTIANEYDKALLPFLLSLRGFVTGDLEAIKAGMSAYILTALPGAFQRLGQWSFSEVEHVIAQTPDGPLKSLFIEIVEFFKGARPLDAIKASLDLEPRVEVAPHD